MKQKQMSTFESTHNTPPHINLYRHGGFDNSYVPNQDNLNNHFQFLTIDDGNGNDSAQYFPTPQSQSH